MRNKRINLIFVVLSLFFCSALSAATLTGVTVKTTDTLTRVAINADSSFEYRTMEFQDPLRLVVDIEGASYNWNEKNLLVEDNTILGLRFSRRGGSPPTIRVVIDRIVVTKYNLITSGTSLIIEFLHDEVSLIHKEVYVGQVPQKTEPPPAKGGAIGVVKGIKEDISGNTSRFIVEGDNLSDYRAFTLIEPTRLVIDIKAVLAENIIKRREINRGGLAVVRFGQFKSQPDPVARVVFQFDKPTKYRMEKFDNKPGVIIEFAAGMQAEVEKVKPQTPPKAAVEKEPSTPQPQLPPVHRIKTPEPKADIFRQSVSLNYRHKPANQILVMIANKYNLVFTGERLPRQRVSIKLKGVSVIKALTEILALCNYDLRREGSVITLIRKEEPAKKEEQKPFVIRPQFQDEKRAQKVVMDLKLIQLNSLLKDRLKIIWQPFKGSFNKRLVLGIPENEKEFRETLKAMYAAKEVTVINKNVLEMKSGEKDRLVMGQRGEFLSEKHDEEGNMTLVKSFYDLGCTFVVRGTIYGSKIKVHMNAYTSVIPVSRMSKKAKVFRREVVQEIEIDDQSTLIIGGIVRAEDKLTHEQKSMISKIPLLGKVTSEESIERIPIEVMTIFQCRIE